MIARSLLCAVLLARSGWVPAASAQAPGTPSAGEWNDDRVLELVADARRARHSAILDEALRTYRAEARGYVYFFVDRPDSDDHTLVKADQVALDLFWMAPSSTKQRIVGQRDQRVLPTSIRYHLDHLTVVQDDFGDRIRLGDGDEVAAVTHPVAPGAESVYDYRVVDSLRIEYGEDREEVRVLEVQVRPRDMERPGYVGTLFLDVATRAIVRMNFSFTPSSYVDPYLDYIRISLDNSLWLGRHWLPRRQEVELRREVPILDFSAGSVIRSRFDIRGYELNADLPRSLFAGGRVSAASLAERARFPFERGLFEEIDEQGLTVSPTMEEVRTQVREVVEREVLSGLAPIRLHADGISDFARYNRAEGVFLGAGLTLQPVGALRVRPSLGYAFGRRRASGAISLHGSGSLSPTLEAYWDRLGDIGGHPGATPLVNTIAAVSGSKDYLDPFFRRGATLTLGSPGPATVSFRLEEHVGARDVVSDGPDSGFRPVRSIDEGTYAGVSLSLRRPLPTGAQGAVTLGAGRLGARGTLSADGSVDWTIGSPRQGPWSRITAEGGWTNPSGPIQTLFLIGGRETLPGLEYRAFHGNAYWLVRSTGTVPVRKPYLGARAFGVVGASYLGAVELPADWTSTDSDGVRASVGLGLSLAWDTVFLDFARSVRGGGWEAVLSVSQQFQGWM